MGKVRERARRTKRQGIVISAIVRELKFIAVIEMHRDIVRQVIWVRARVIWPI
jgi:hypothetical protein